MASTALSRSLFFRQFWALCVKNWIVLKQHWFLNLIRCFIGPIAFGVFLAVAQLFLIKPNNYGIGSPIPVFNLSTIFDPALTFAWADLSNSNGASNFSAQDVMSLVTRGFSSEQLQSVKEFSSLEDIYEECPENYQLKSLCEAAVVFNSFPSSQSANLNYTILFDGGLGFIDVVRHTSDVEQRVLPLQWAIDSAIIELTTGTKPPTPLEWPFTQMTNEQQSTNTRLGFINGINSLLVIAFFICYIGIAYQLPGSFMGERATLLTSHMQAMGLRNVARILSWHFSISIVYLPAWIIVALTWHYQVFTNTSVWLVLAIHLLLGLSIASWSLFLGVPFGKSPQLAAVASIFFNILFSILALVAGHMTTGGAFIFSIIFPPAFYIYSIRSIGGYEEHQIPTNAIKGDPDNNLVLLPLLIAALINVFIWPYFTVLLERRLYDAHEPQSSSSWLFWRKEKVDSAVHSLPSDIAISVRNLNKTFKSSWFSRKSDVVAISDLTFDVPKTGIFVLLGSNGAGKSTALSVFAGLLGRTSGSIIYEGGVTTTPRQTLGIVPQKNVLFPDLTCYQTLKVWNAIKSSSAEAMNGEDIEQLLKDCDLGHKIHAAAGTLSGGQKRKLQLAIGLIGNSKVVLVDECTSGVDPLSRRAIWRTLTSVRHDRTIIFTTHFLDEADLLADNIAILAAPGKLVAQGSPVSLKSSLGQGYVVQVLLKQDDTQEKSRDNYPNDLLEKIQGLAPLTHMTRTVNSSGALVYYHLQTANNSTVEKVLSLVELECSNSQTASYDVRCPTMEDIFLALMTKHGQGIEAVQKEEPEAYDSKDSEDHVGVTVEPVSSSTTLNLTNGRRRSPIGQALTIFHKRLLIARRSWLTPFLTVLIAVAGACIPIFFLSDEPQLCVRQFKTTPSIPLYLPLSPLELATEIDPVPGSTILVSPPNVTSALGPTAAFLQTTNIANNDTFVATINSNYRNLSVGGVSIDTKSNNALVAYAADYGIVSGSSILNLFSNIALNQELSASGRSPTPLIIGANYQSLPGIGGNVLVSLKWLAFFGAAMAVYPAFFAMYVSNERRSSVQAMQLSNGLSNPTGLWLGHLMFDSIFGVIIATICTIVFAAASNQFHGLGFFWLVLVLYGITGPLFAYCVTLITTSPLAAFAVVAAYQIIMFILYTAGYLLTLTYAKITLDTQIINIIHFTLSLISPVASVLRAAFVSVNLFSLLCDGTELVTTASLGQITRYGGPILYLIVYSFVLFAFLVWYDSGLTLPRRTTSRQGRRISEAASFEDNIPDDVRAEAIAVQSLQDPLSVLNVSKTFGKAKTKAVDNVSFGVSNNTVLALLGPNGAGKTSTFNMIRGDIVPDTGDVLVEGTSVVNHPRTARLSLGVCPQFTAIDSQLTVREHLSIYGRLKGLRSGAEIQANVDALMKATALYQYADRLASKLSGGNQRKLSLAIALIGNPSVILIDEFSTGIDAKIKRDMWITLRNVAVGKAVVITTHSMEEASALANKIAIIAGKMLAVGPIESLTARYPIYEIHFSCRTREEVQAAQQLMARIPGSRMADDVATRFEVPLGGPESHSLAELFRFLSEHGQFSEYTVERVSLESIFLKVIRSNNVKEEDSKKGRQWWRVC